MNAPGQIETRKAAPEAGKVPLSRGLSTKLLLLTALFVLLAEVLIFLPSIANYRLRWLEERLATAAAVTTLLLESGPAGISREVQDELLLAIGARAVAIRDQGMSRLLLVSDMPPGVDEHVDLAASDMWTALRGAVATGLFGGGRVLRVYGPVGESDKEFELVLVDTALRQALLTYARSVAVVSLFISLLTATLVFYVISRVMIRPIRDMTRSMLAFAGAPEDPARIIEPEPRGDEIGVAQRELAAMQTNLQRTLGEQKHLADLGLAVSKINHDMRNMLASARLISDRLRSVEDPTVQAFLPKLVRTLDRAVSYSRNVLAYGAAQEPAPSRRRLDLRQLVDEVHAVLALEAPAGAELVNAVSPGLEADADSEQIFRVLVNLGRNALQAMAGDKESVIVKRLTIGGEREGSVTRIAVEDTGPGLPRKARENLFAAFRGSARSGGTGLGLAIAHELVRAHGGTIELAESRGGRTLFEISIPDQPVRLEQARGRGRRQA